MSKQDNPVCELHETISNLQVMVSNRDAKISEMNETMRNLDIHIMNITLKRNIEIDELRETLRISVNNTERAIQNEQYTTKKLQDLEKLVESFRGAAVCDT